MSRKWVRMGSLGSQNANEAEAGVDRSKGQWGAWRAGIRTSFIPEVLHDTVSGAIFAEICSSDERGNPAPRHEYGDGLYAEVEVSEPGERPGTVLTVTTGQCYVNRFGADAERAS